VRIEDQDTPEDERTLEAFLRCHRVDRFSKEDLILACMELLSITGPLAEGIVNSVITRLSALNEIGLRADFDERNYTTRFVYEWRKDHDFA
jgi:hypothetical protein